MSKQARTLIYSVEIKVGKQSSWSRLFIGRPVDSEVVNKLEERCRHEFTKPPALTCDVNLVYDDMIELVLSYGLPLRGQTLECEVLGTCIGSIKITQLAMGTLTCNGKTILANNPQEVK
jgi:hypothetical protein